MRGRRRHIGQDGAVGIRLLHLTYPTDHILAAQARNAVEGA